MAAKFVVVLALVAAGQCSVVPLAKVDSDYSSFAYDVADPHTGDYKSQVETRVNGAVAGQYSLLDADGTKRTVDYTADDVSGFNAVVRKDPVLTAPLVAPAVYSAPVVAKTIAPVVSYSSPVVSAPVLSKTVVSPYASSVVASPFVAKSVVPAPVYSSPLLSRSIPLYYDFNGYGRAAYGSPLAYSAYSAPLSYW